LSLVPFISSRIHTGSRPRPDHLRDLFFFALILWLGLRPLAFTAGRYSAIAGAVAAVASKPSVSDPIAATKRSQSLFKLLALSREDSVDLAA